MFWQLFGSLRQAKQRREAKKRSKERVKKTEDSSCSLPSHFWGTSRSPFSTCYIPFQSSGSQESNTSNRVRFGAEMRKIWPSEDNCSRLVRNFCTTPCVVRVLCEIRTTLSNFAQPMRGANFALFLPTPLYIFSYVFFDVISFLILVTNQSQAFAFVKTI